MRINLHDGFYLSPVQDGDQAAFVEHFRDKETTDHLLRVPYPYTAAHADAWVRHCAETHAALPKPVQFAVRRRDGYLIGGIGFVMNRGTSSHRAELGYWLARAHRNRDLASAAAMALVHYAFDRLHLGRIEATVALENKSSQRVLEKSGFVREGILQAYYLQEGRHMDACLYARLAPSPRAPAAAPTQAST
jgi:RimJ/RimL family protein N-acetyltransferase